MISITWDGKQSEQDVCQSGQASQIFLSGENASLISGRNSLLIKSLWLFEFILFWFVLYFLIFLICDCFIRSKTSARQLLGEITAQSMLAALFRDSLLLLAVIAALVLTLNITQLIYFAPGLIFLVLEFFYQSGLFEKRSSAKAYGIVVSVLALSILVNFAAGNRLNSFAPFSPTFERVKSNSFNSLVNIVTNQRTNAFIFGYENVLFQRELRISQKDAGDLALTLDKLETQTRISQLTVEEKEFASLNAADVACLLDRSHTAWKVAEDSSFIFLDQKYYSAADAVVVRRQENTYFLVPSSINDAQSWCQ